MGGAYLMTYLLESHAESFFLFILLRTHLDIANFDSRDLFQVLDLPCVFVALRKNGCSPRLIGVEELL
jgi:hypothetical protein